MVSDFESSVSKDPLLMVKTPLPNADEVFPVRLPASTVPTVSMVVPPLKVLVPSSSVVPDPVTSIVPVPVKTLVDAWRFVPAAIHWIWPLLVTLFVKDSPPIRLIARTET